ncbi:hypothetical protein NUM3379_04810 [Kineococcus sp. NUM-3379]
MNPSPFEAATGKPGAGRAALSRRAVTLLLAAVCAPALVLLLGIGALVVPALLGTHDDADPVLRSRLESAGAAQSAFHTLHGAYTARAAELGGGVAPAELAVLRAEQQTFCLVARRPGSAQVLFLDESGAVSAEPCA